MHRCENRASICQRSGAKKAEKKRERNRTKRWIKRERGGYPLASAPKGVVPCLEGSKREEKRAPFVDERKRKESDSSIPSNPSSASPVPFPSLDRSQQPLPFTADEHG